jgi:tRNA1(Val) A37 N6-methylase TrmN6
MDAVLLCAFTKVDKGERVLDLGTGNGVIPILLKGRTEGKHFTGLEIQDVNVDLARRSVQYNRIEDDVLIVQGDIKEASKIFGGASFDVVTTNPPYMNENHGLKNPESHKAIARHEILCTLEDVIREGTKVLKPGGRFNMIHRPHRLVEIIELMKKYRVEPKRIRFVHPFADKEANMVLIEGIRGAKPMVKIEPPLVIYEATGVYTEEVKNLYQ